MVNFPTWIPDSDSSSFKLQRAGDASFQCTAYAFFPADWYNLCDQLKNVPWEDILRLGAFAAGTEFYEWVQTGSDVFITHYKYQLILHLF